MADSSVGAARAVRGIEAAAYVAHHALEVVAVASGEGARRLAGAIAQEGGPERLPGEGLSAARAALGAAMAGKRTGLVVSGDGMLEVLPALREMVRVGAPVLLLVPSHGPEFGGTLPAGGPHDVALLASLPIGVLVAADAAQVAEFGLAAIRAAHDRGAPWAVAFDFAQVGLALANTTLPSAETVRAWAGEVHAAASGPSLGAPEEDLERYTREIERFGFALGAAMRDLERRLRHAVAPVLVDGARDPDVVVIALGTAARAARVALTGTTHSIAVLQVASLRPFPAADLVRLAWRARAVIVHEPLPEPLGVGGGLSDAVRASFADALTWHPAFAGIGRIPPVVTLLGSDTTAEHWAHVLERVADAGDPPRLMAAQPGARGPSGGGRIDIAMDEKGRESALRLIVDWLARAGTTVVAHAHEPTRAGLEVSRTAGGRGPAHVLLMCAGGPDDAVPLESLPAGSAVVLAGDFPDRVLAETMRTCAGRGIRVATLHAHGEPLRNDAAIAAVVWSMLAGDAKVDAAFEASVRDALGTSADAVITQARAFAEALRAQFA